jgi:hypothetical protein
MPLTDKSSMATSAVPLVNTCCVPSVWVVRPEMLRAKAQLGTSPRVTPGSTAVPVVATAVRSVKVAPAGMLATMPCRNVGGQVTEELQSVVELDDEDEPVESDEPVEPAELDEVNPIAC